MTEKGMKSGAHNEIEWHDMRGRGREVLAVAGRLVVSKGHLSQRLNLHNSRGIKSKEKTGDGFNWLTERKRNPWRSVIQR